MIEFILNNKTIRTELPSGYLLLDFIREHQQLKGTKIGCREGDCGACTVLIGILEDGMMRYINATSCLTPIGNIHGKHIVSIEGLNMDKVSPVQQTIIDHSGTQCGFCTVGFVVSLTEFCLTNDHPSYDRAITAISGNICRCTGYKSIEKAAESLVIALKEKPSTTPINWLVDHGFIPTYFEGIPARLKEIPPYIVSDKAKIVGGGTDLYVQKQMLMSAINIRPITTEKSMKYIHVRDGFCTIGAGTTVSELSQNGEFRSIFPALDTFFKLISSAPIRNISTIVGNFVNASPIGDLTAFFLALDTMLTIKSDNKIRKVYLKDFYKGYKDFDLSANEFISEFSFKLLTSHHHFNLEKISKRIHLDIASVNTALNVQVDDQFMIKDIHIAVGGVGPIPTYLFKTRKFLINKKLTAATIIDANEIMQQEISPIGDVRGPESYKRLLLRQLFYGHFIQLFPDTIQFGMLID